MSSPSDIPGVIYWWCSEDIAGATGDSVVGWADRITNRTLAPGGTATTAPTIADINGIRSATSASTTGTSLRSTFSLPANYTVGFIWRRLNTATSRGPISMYNASSGTASRRFNTTVSTTALSISVYRDAGTTSIVDRLDYDTGTPHVVTLSTRPSEGHIEMFVNGASDGAVTGVAGASQTGTHAMSIFQNNQASGNTTPGHFYDAIFFDHDLTPSERATWHTYAQDRGLGITVSDYTAPSTSPFTVWTGSVEQPLSLEGIWDGQQVDPATFEITTS